MSNRVSTHRYIVCKTDNACANFPVPGGRDPDDDNNIPGGGEIGVANMTCYNGGVTVYENHQTCDVTSPYLAPTQHTTFSSFQPFHRSQDS